MSKFLKPLQLVEQRATTDSKRPGRLRAIEAMLAQGQKNRVALDIIQWLLM